MAILSVRTTHFLRHHTAIIASGSGPLIESFVPLDDLTSGAAKAVSVENLSTADTHMTGDDLLAFALAERGNFLPGNLPPSGGFHGSLLPVGSIHDSQPAFRVAHPPEMLGRHFLCCWHKHHPCCNNLLESPANRGLVSRSMFYMTCCVCGAIPSVIAQAL